MQKKENNKKTDKKMLIIGILAVVALAIIIAIAFMLTQNKKPVEPNIDVVSDLNEIKEKLDIEIKDPNDAKDLVYGIENDTIAVVKYKKKVTDGYEMNFILRSSSSTEDIENSIGLGVEFPYEPITMPVECKDGTQVDVEAKVALDIDTSDMRYMKALWYDNDKYYSMVTDNLYTREDFLQEVNRVIIANHVTF